MTQIAYNFDFDNNGSNVASQHEERRERQNALAPIIFNEYERLFVALCSGLGDPDFTTYTGIEQNNVGDAVRTTYSVMYQRTENLDTYKFDKAGGTITGNVVVTTDHTITAPVFISSVTGDAGSGSSPFAVISTRRVENLNSDLLDYRHAGVLSGDVPINGQGLCHGLDSDLWDGQHSSSALIFKNAANSTAAFQVQNLAGSTMFNIDTTNSRVGINTISPKEALDVSGGARITGAVSVGDTTAGLYLSYSEGISYIQSMAPTVAYYPVHMRLTELQVQIGAGNTRQLQVDASGNTLLGSPNGTHKLNVEGNVRATSSMKIGPNAEATITYNSTEGSIDFVIG